MTVTHIQPGPFLSQATAFGQLVFVAGQVASDTSQDVGGQTRQVLASIDALLAEAGSDKSKLLSAQIFLRNIGDWAAMNEVWSGWIGGHKPPARATVEARLAGPDYLVEIVVVAAR